MRFDLENHKQYFPNSCVVHQDNRLYGWWFIGNNYKAKNGYYGEYPPTYIDRVQTLFPPSGLILHMFSGCIEPGFDEVTCDINPKNNADFICKGEEIDQRILEPTFSLIMADPPYSAEHAKEYGYKMPNKPKVMRALRKIIKPEGVLVWLDTRRPIYRKQDWIWSGVIGLDCGTNRLVRGVYIFEPRGE